MKVAWDEHHPDWMDGGAAVAGMLNGETPTFRLPPGPVEDGEAIEPVADDGWGSLNATRQEQGNGGPYGGVTGLCTDADVTDAPLIDPGFHVVEVDDGLGQVVGVGAVGTGPRPPRLGPRVVEELLGARGRDQPGAAGRSSPVHHLPTTRISMLVPTF